MKYIIEVYNMKCSNNSYISPIFIFVVLPFFLQGCGSLQGNIQPISLNIDKQQTTMIDSELVSGSIDFEKDGSELLAVGVQNWGKFGDQDFSIFKQSILNNIELVNVKSTSKKKGKIYIYVILRRYLVATSNNSCSVLACISWCATDQEDKILFHEQFYSSMDTSRYLGTIGTLKDMTNKGIIERIIDVSIALASREPATSHVFHNYPANTFASLEEASKDLPNKMQSHFMLLGSAGTYMGTSDIRYINYKNIQPHKIDWINYLDQKKL